jgi:hypothetical protein
MPHTLTGAVIWAAVVAVTFVLYLAWLRWSDARDAAREVLPGPSGARPCSRCERLTARVTEDGERVCKACAVH